MPGVRAARIPDTDLNLDAVGKMRRNSALLPRGGIPFTR